MSEGSRKEQTEFKILLQLFGISILVISLLELLVSISQVFLGRSIGLTMLGESIFNIGSAGNISRSLIFNRLILRGYGTFPHPNILATYSYTIILLGIYILQISRQDEFLDHILNIKQLQNLRKIWRAIIYINIITIFLTQSRTHILLLVPAIYLLIYSYVKYKDRKLINILLTLSSTITLFIILSQTTISTSFYNRLALNIVAINTMFLNFPHGVGAGLFTTIFESVKIYSNGRSFVQPVHNIYLLLITELGITGFILSIFLFGILFAFTFLSIKKKNYINILLACYIFLISNIDHLFITQPQGLTIFVTYIVIIIFTLILNQKRGLQM